MSEPALMEPAYERAFAKLNLLLHVGNQRDDGMHPICSIFASFVSRKKTRSRARPIRAGSKQPWHSSQSMAAAWRSTAGPR